MTVAPTVLPGRSFAQDKPNSQLLFHWRAQDRSLVTVDRLSTGTLTRASAGGLTDGRGQRTANALTDVRLVGPAADNQPRWGVSTGGVPHLLLEATRTNLQPISNPTTGWQITDALSTGGETTVAPDGTGVVLLANNSTVTGGRMFQDVEVASTVSIISWYTKWNNSTFNNVHSMRLFDNSTAAVRGGVFWEFASTGAMAITSTVAGNVISAPTHIGNNWWKTSLECTGISTGNDNQLELRPDFSVPPTTGGDMFIAHVQIEDVASTGLFASSHIPTVTTAITRAAETLSWPYLSTPKELTVYVKFIESGTAQVSDAKLLEIGKADGSAPHLRIADGGSAKYFVRHNNGISNVDAFTATTPSAGDVVEIRVNLFSNGSVQIHQTINGGADISSAITASLAFAADWADTKLFVNGPVVIGFNKFREIKVSSDTKTLQEMRESF